MKIPGEYLHYTKLLPFKSFPICHPSLILPSRPLYKLSSEDIVKKPTEKKIKISVLESGYSLSTDFHFTTDTK
jgi:hypothetical protein